MDLVWIAIGGAAGAVARYSMDRWVTSQVGSAFPWGTLLINVSGSLAVGFLATVVVERSLLPPVARLLILTGFVGAYTTFSTWILESIRLAESGSFVAAVANVAGSVVLGVLAVGTGIVIGRAL